jgi:CBS domain-containing protein
MTQRQEMGGRTGMGAQQTRRTGQTPLRSVTIENILQEDVVRAEPDTPLHGIVSKMRESDVGAVVIEEDGEPTGILTDRQIVLSLEEMDLSERTAEDLVQDDLVTGTSELSVFDVLRKLNDENVRRLPIVDDDGELEGIVTLDDVLVLLGSELGKAAEIIKAQSPRL